MVDHHVEGERRFAQCIHEVGDGQWCDVPLAGVLQLGDLQGVALGRVGFEVVDFTDDELVGREFTTGGVVDDILSDPGGEDDGGVGGAAFGLVPVAGEIFGGIDDDGAAAMFDAPEGIGARGQEVLGPPDGVVIGKGPELVLFFGEEFLHELLEPDVEFGAGAAGIGEEEPALLDVVAEVLLGEAIELGDLVSVEENDGRLKEVGDRGKGRIDDLPGEEVFPVAGDDGDEVADVVGIVVPVAPGPMAELVDQDRARPLARNKSAKLVATTGCSVTPLQKPDSRSWVRTNSSAPWRYQSCWPKKRIPASRPARSIP